MDIDKLIEGVARAIVRGSHADCCSGVAADDVYDVCKGKYDGVARAAILATLRGVREPGREHEIKAGWTYYEENAPDYSWQAMLDTLIKQMEDGH